VFKSLAFLAFIFLISQNLFSQQGGTIIRFKESAGGDPALEHLVGRFNESIGNAVRKHFSTSTAPRRRNDTVYEISFNMDLRKDIDLNLQIVVGRITNNGDDAIFEADFPFSYPQTESLLTFIGEALIGKELGELFSGAVDAADLNESIGRQFAEYQLEAEDVPAVVFVYPEWGKEIPEDTPIYVKSLPLRLSIESFQVEKRSRADDFPLSSEIIYYGNIPDAEASDELPPEKKQLFDFLRNIKPQMVINHDGRNIATVTGVGETYEIIAGKDPITEYITAYSFVPDVLPDEEYKLDPGRVNKTYKIRQIPYYDFSGSMRRLNANTLVCGFDDSTAIICDINLFLAGEDFEREYSKPRSWHYMYIDQESAAFLNTIRGDMEIIVSQNFDMNVSIVRYAIDGAAQLSDRFKLGDRRNEYLLDYLLDINEYGEVVTRAQTTNGNRFRLTLNEAIDTHKADWFIRMEFTDPDNEADRNDLLFLKSLEKPKTISSFPVSDSARTLIAGYINDRGKDGFKNNNGYYLDIAKLLMYLGYKRDSGIYLNYYKDGLGNRYQINNNNEKYKITFYERLIDYYYGLRYGDPVQYSPPSNDLINETLEKDSLVVRMGQFSGIGTDMNTIPLAGGVLFEVRKRSETRGSVSASEFMTFNFPELLTGYILRLPGLDPEDVRVLRDVFIQ
jgi:hypothetical protein